jgi:hypothetical protein
LIETFHKNWNLWKFKGFHSGTYCFALVRKLDNPFDPDEKAFYFGTQKAAHEHMYGAPTCDGSECLK